MTFLRTYLRLCRLVWTAMRHGTTVRRYNASRAGVYAIATIAQGIADAAGASNE